MAIKKGSGPEWSLDLLMSGLGLVISSLEDCLAKGRDSVAVFVAACSRREHVEIESFARKRSTMAMSVPQGREEGLSRAFASLENADVAVY